MMHSTRELIATDHYMNIFYQSTVDVQQTSEKEKQMKWFITPGGVLGYKRGGGGGGVRCIFLGLKFSTPVFFGVEDLTVYFFGSEKSARIFWGSNFRQANSSYTIKKSHVYFWV